MSEFKIVTVDADNLDKFGIFCVKNKKHPGAVAKHAWLSDRFAEGLRFKLMLTDDGKQAGFLEYTPGEFTWRVVDAPDYLVIHCLWVESKKFPGKGLASTLIQHCVADAQSEGKAGVAVVTSDGTWMATKKVYLKNGFQEVDQAEPHFQLLAKQTRSGALPSFPHNWAERRQAYSGLNLLYTNQCPFIAKAVQELPPVAEKYGMNLKLIEFNDPAEARAKMVSPYGMMNLVHDGQLLVDHAISATRFKNILQKDLHLKPQT